MARQPSSSSDVLLYLLAIFISPLAVALKAGCGSDTWINLALFILGWIPGVIHAWWVISRYERLETRPGAHAGHPGHYNASAPPPAGPPPATGGYATGASYGQPVRKY